MEGRSTSLKVRPAAASGTLTRRRACDRVALRPSTTSRALLPKLVLLRLALTWASPATGTSSERAARGSVEEPDAVDGTAAVDGRMDRATAATLSRVAVAGVRMGDFLREDGRGDHVAQDGSCRTGGRGAARDSSLRGTIATCDARLKGRHDTSGQGGVRPVLALGGWGAPLPSAAREARVLLRRRDGGDSPTGFLVPARSAGVGRMRRASAMDGWTGDPRRVVGSLSTGKFRLPRPVHRTLTAPRRVTSTGGGPGRPAPRASADVSPARAHRRRPGPGPRTRAPGRSGRPRRRGTA